MYKLSQLAEEDIYQIARYTIQQFGVTQAKKYHNDLKQTFELLAKAPWIGLLYTSDAADECVNV